MNIAIIPARLNSKRIPKKNIKKFCGKPMIYWSIYAAKKSNLFEKIIVSTDSDEIAKIAQKYGAIVPFLRPKKLSGDFIGTTPVVSHAANWAKSQGWDIKYVCCIYPTAALINVIDLKKAYKKISSNQFSYVIAASRYSAPIFRSFKVLGSKGLKMFFPDYYLKRSQDIEVAYFDAGQFYWGKLDSWIKQEKGYSDKSTIQELPSWRVQDLDTNEDWKRAEFIFKLLRKNEK